MSESMNDEALLCVSKCINSAGKPIRKEHSRSRPVLGGASGDGFPEGMHESVSRAEWTRGRIEYRFL